ncbi:AI-2E family transporter, partial [Nocardia sp.]|uniref:AI-2E family transporter n=1 Tax=Nocardia sp. TaxID=1821 RepID=UPI0025835936
MLLWGLIYIRVVTIPVILAVFVTALLMPPTNWMRRNGMGRGASTAISVIGGLVLLGGIITLVVQPAISGFTGLVRSVEQGIAGLPGLLQAVGLDPDLADTAINSVQSEVQSALQEDWS